MPRAIKPRYEPVRVQWLDQVRFDERQTEELKECLSKDIDPETVPEAIDALRLICRLGLGEQQYGESAPKPREVTAALENIANLAFNLAHALEYRDRVIRDHCEEPLQKAIGSIPKFAENLNSLGAAAATEIAKGVPAHTRASHEEKIKWIANTLTRFGVKCRPSTNKKLRFFRIASVCFDAMGINASPESAIRKFKSVQTNGE